MEDFQEHYSFAVIRDEDSILLYLGEDWDTTRDFAIENKAPIYVLDYQLDKNLLGKPILNGSCRWKFTLEDLI